MSSCNLVSDAWIDVVYTNGEHAAVSLHTLFDEANDIAMLDVSDPLERTALMRLVLAIMYKSGAYREQLINDYNNHKHVVLDYLDTWQKRFYIFDDEHPFLQTPSLAQYATENTNLKPLGPRFWRNYWSKNYIDVPITPAQAIRQLIATNAFGKSGIGAGFEGQLGATKGKANFFSPGASANIVNVFIIKENLAKTLAYNFLDSNNVTNAFVPWEHDPQEPNGFNDFDIDNPATAFSLQTRVAILMKNTDGDVGMHEPVVAGALVTRGTPNAYCAARSDDKKCADYDFGECERWQDAENLMLHIADRNTGEIKNAHSSLKAASAFPWWTHLSRYIWPQNIEQMDDSTAMIEWIACAYDSKSTVIENVINRRIWVAKNRIVGDEKETFDSWLQNCFELKMRPGRFMEVENAVLNWLSGKKKELPAVQIE